MAILKNICRFIIKPLFILSIVLVGLLAAIIIYNGLANNIDFGSFPDWISAGGSVGTLIIAWLALRAAPHWVRQKIDEDAVLIAQSLIEKHQKLREVLANISWEVNKFTSQLNKIHQDINNYTPGLLVATVSATIDAQKSFGDVIRQIVDAEQKLILKGWVIKDKYKFSERMNVGIIEMPIKISIYIEKASNTAIIIDKHFRDVDQHQALSIIESELNNSLIEVNEVIRKCFAKSEAVFKLKNPVFEAFKRY